MLPLIVIGASDRVTEILEPFAEVGRIVHHPTAEAAYYALLDGDAADLGAVIEADGRWPVNVAYGPKAFGELCTAKVGTAAIALAQLPHSGHTLVFDLDVHDPRLAIRAVKGEPIEEPEHTMVWQAAVNVKADLIMDLESEGAVQMIGRYLAWRTVDEH